jgi:Flp pilus assembly secretin CpaC
MKSVIIATALLASTAAIAQPEIHVTEGFVRHLEYSEPIGSVSVGDAKVADVLPLTDREFLVQSHKIGTTNLLMLSKDKKVLDEIIIVVDRPISGLVRIHNKALINSYTEFSCAENGCQYVGENTVQEPAPLPRGHVQQHFEGIYHQDGGQQAPIAPSPALVEPSQ